jgi:hypothetical protein
MALIIDFFIRIRILKMQIIKFGVEIFAIQYKSYKI